MNIASVPSKLLVAKTCGCKDNNKRKVTYAFSEQFHDLCIDKKDIIRAEIEACEKLLKYAKEEADRIAIERELLESKTALDLIQ
jgi:hypothetical protein